MGTPRHQRDDRGAAAVEFALVVIPLLYLVFGVIAYGYMLSFRQDLSQAAAQGARIATVASEGATVGEIEQAITLALSDYDVVCRDGDLTRDGQNAGQCLIQGPGTCDWAQWTDDEDGNASEQPPAADAGEPECRYVTVAYNYNDDPFIPNVGYGYVLPDVLEYRTAVRVS